MTKLLTRDKVCECTFTTGTGQARPEKCKHGNRLQTEAELRPKQPPSRKPRRRSSSSSTPPIPCWLTEGFALGVDQREAAEAVRSADPYGCWLAQFDPLHRPCTNSLERCHIIKRQRVEKVLDAMLDGAEVEEYWDDWNGEEGGAGCDSFAMPKDWREELVQLAAWDPRNARLGCTGHHPRFDSHATPRLYVPYDALPDHVLEFAEDWGLELELERQCPKRPDLQPPPTNKGSVAAPGKAA